MHNVIAAGFGAALIFAVASFNAVPAKAESGSFFTFSGDLIGKTKKSGKVEPAEDLSGIACAEATGFPRRCLLIDDEAQAAQFVVVEDGRIIAGAAVPLTDKIFDDKPLEFDGEGVGFANEAFYVIGSHGHPRDKDHTEDQPKDLKKFAEKIQTVSVIQRITIKPADIDPASGQPKMAPKITPTAALRALLGADKELQPFVDARLEKNGLTIEGVAIRDGQLYAGLRAPVLGDGKQAAIFKVALDALFEGKQAAPELIKLSLGDKRGVRDLVRYENGFLLLAGPSDDPSEKHDIPAGAYTVFWWDGQQTLEPLDHIDGVKLETRWAKPEALLPLGLVGDRLRLLVLFDGAPAAFAARADNIKKPSK